MVRLFDNGFSNAYWNKEQVRKESMLSIDKLVAFIFIFNDSLVLQVVKKKLISGVERTSSRMNDRNICNQRQSFVNQLAPN